MSQLKNSQREQILPYINFCSIQTSKGLNEAHPHGGGQSALLNLLIQMLVSARNTIIDAPRIMFNQMSGNPASQFS